MPITEEQITVLDTFISNNEPDPNDKDFHGLSICDLENGKNEYKILREKKGPEYEIFGSNAMGYNCYSLYKSRQNTIYVFTVYMQSPQSYYIIEDESWFCN
jgi:hypothetical protein